MALEKIQGLDWLVKEQNNEDVIAAAVQANAVVAVMATDAEAITGTATTLGINPANLQAVLKGDVLTIATAALGTVRLIHGEITCSYSGISGGTVAGTRGSIKLTGTITAGGAYLYGAQGKLTITGTQNHADSRLCAVMAQIDATGGTLSAGMLSGVWIDMLGITGIPFAEFNAIRISSNYACKFTSLLYAQADASFVFDWVIPTNGANAFVATAGTGATSAGNAAGVATKVFLVRSSGTTYYVPMFAVNAN